MRLSARLLGATILTGLCTTPAMARDDQAYIEIDGGVVFAEDFDIIEIEPATGPLGSLDTDTGWEAAGIVGYDFGGFRLEAEGAYRTLGNDVIDTPAGSLEDLEGDASAFSAMLNGLIDLGKDDGVQFYFGGGAGYAWVNHEVGVSVSQTGVTLFDGDGSSFAWQGIAGLRFPLSRGADLGIKYKYFNITDYDMDFDDAVFETDWASHSVLATLSFNLGGSEPPPKPACNTGPYIVFFEFDSADLTAEATQILNSAVTAYANCGSARIMLAGHTDRSGQPKYNMGLAERRNASVQTYITGRGVPADRITAEAFGETKPRVPTEDGVREAQNRRVEVTYGPGSGM